MFNLKKESIPEELTSERTEKKESFFSIIKNKFTKAKERENVEEIGITEEERKKTLDFLNNIEVEEEIIEINVDDESEEVVLTTEKRDKMIRFKRFFEEKKIFLFSKLFFVFSFLGIYLIVGIYKEEDSKINYIKSEISKLNIEMKQIKNDIVIKEYYIKDLLKWNFNLKRIKPSILEIKKELLDKIIDFNNNSFGLLKIDKIEYDKIYFNKINIVFSYKIKNKEKDKISENFIEAIMYKFLKYIKIEELSIKEGKKITGVIIIKEPRDLDYDNFKNESLNKLNKKGNSSKKRRASMY